MTLGKSNNGKGRGSKKDIPHVKVPEEERAVRLKDLYRQFIDWSVLTDKERAERELPVTQKDFAEKHGISPDTICDWKKRGDFPKERIAAFQEHLSSKTPKVMQALFKRVERYGMGYEVELWLGYVEKWDRKSVLEIDPGITFGDGDIRALLKNLSEDKRKIFYATLAQAIAEAERNQPEGEVRPNAGKRVATA